MKALPPRGIWKKFKRQLLSIETVPAPTPKEEAPKVPSTPTANQLIVVVKSKVGKFGVKVYETASIQSHVVATEKVRAKLNGDRGSKQSQTQNWQGW